MPNVDHDKEYQPNPNSKHKIKSLICVPITFGDLCLGVITIDGKQENAFKEQDINTVEVYAEIAALVRMIEIVQIQQLNQAYNMEEGDFNDSEEE